MSSPNLSSYLATSGTEIGKSGTTLYASFLIQAAAGQGIALGLDARDPTTLGSGLPGLGFEIWDDNGATTFRFNRGDNGSDLDVAGNNNVNLVVFKMDFTGDTTGILSYYLNPTDLTVEGNNTVDAATDSRSIGFNGLFFSQAGESGYNASYIDEFRLADSWGASLFTETTPVPEPSTYAALAGVLALGLAVLRRRR